MPFVDISRPLSETAVRVHASQTAPPGAIHSWKVSESVYYQVARTLPYRTNAINVMELLIPVRLQNSPR